MVVDLVISDGKIYTPFGFYNGSLAIDEGKIVSLAKGTQNLKADEVIDAGGNFVLPGMIDMHVHFRDPGFPEREDFETGTRAAAFGGVTTVVDMPNTNPPVTSLEALKKKVEIVEKKAIVDFALIGGAGELDRGTLLSMAEGGIVGYKTFMISRFKELAASDGRLLENFGVISETGLPCLVHAENEDIVSRGIEKASEVGRVDPIAHAEFRPPIAEEEAVIRTITISKNTNVHLHICHMSTKGATDFLKVAKTEGFKVTGETSCNYLLLTSEIMKKIGPYAKIDPPLRSKSDNKSLWDAIRNGVVDVLASDHAPYPEIDKEKGWSNIFEAPSGGIGVETSLPLMLESVNRGLIRLGRLVDVFSIEPAKVLGIYPKKGALIPGADGDVVIVDIRREYQIMGEHLHSKQKKSAFEGFKGRGVPLSTIVRGNVIIENNKDMCTPGYGMFVKPIKNSNRPSYDTKPSKK